MVLLFANKYNAIYNDIDMYCIKQEDDEILAHTHNISIDDVRLAIKHLKICKSDGIDGIFSVNFINETELLFSYISMLFNMMLTHDVAP